jgi:hypothetical protein
MHAILVCALISVAPPPAPTFDEVILVPGEDGERSYLYLVITEEFSDVERLHEIVVQYAAAALREAKRLKFRDFPGRPVVPGEDFKYEGNVVLAVRDRPHQREAGMTGFMPRQLRTIATAKPDEARKIAARHTWAGGGTLP